MFLCEDYRDDVVQDFKEVIEKYHEFLSVSDKLKRNAELDDIDTNVFIDFIHTELYSVMKDIENDILDKYYPIDYGDNADELSANDVYKDSLKEREKIFNL